MMFFICWTCIMPQLYTVESSITSREWNVSVDIEIVGGVYTGADYEKVGPRQQSRRCKEIKEHIFGLISSYSTVGLQVIPVQLETSCDNAVNLQLMPPDVRPTMWRMMTFQMLLISYWNIEFQLNSIIMVFDNLPKSYKVGITTII